MRRPWGLLVAAGLVASQPAGSADILDPQLGRQPGTVLLTRCEAALALLQAERADDLEAQTLAQARSCIGFIDGFIYGHGWAAWRQNRDMYYCPPEKFLAVNAVVPLVEYLRAHPERLDAPAHVLLFSALSHAFPCSPAGA